jgi:alkylation response protein AidB-like acyl-CoA dehydrogenase
MKEISTQREGKIMSVAKKPLSPAKGDFYHISAILSEEDQDLLHRVRAFMEAEVAPIINQYWIREEFPHQIIPGLAALDIAGLGVSWIWLSWQEHAARWYGDDGNGACG